MVLGVGVLAGSAAFGTRHLRCLRARRGPVQDRQPLFYPAQTFHVKSFLAVPTDRSVIEEVRKLRALLETGGAARLVYAGQAALKAVDSTQLPDVRWNAVVVVQYPSRDARFDRVARVYRPGVDFMRALIGSSFMAGIIGGTQPGDSLAVLTFTPSFPER